MLRQRGLIITDEIQAQHYLRFIGYYRLAGYALPFQVNHNADGSHHFLNNCRFDDILDLYIFDRKLRLTVIDAVERIEVAVRTLLSQSMSELYGSHWFTQSEHFMPMPQFDHVQFITHVKKEIGYAPARQATQPVFIRHYYNKYTEPELPPSWMIFEALSFGSVSRMFKYLKRQNRKFISQAFALDEKYWLHGCMLCLIYAIWQHIISDYGTVRSLSNLLLLSI